MTRAMPQNDRSGDDGPLVVAMATFEGAAFLPEQLASFVDQTRRPDLLLVSDDGSTDTTRAVLSDFAATAPFEVRVMDGPCRGYGRNFASLLERMPAGTGHVALSDQDDVWLPQKLARAVAQLAPIDGPAVYGSRCTEVAQDLSAPRATRGLGVVPAFRHALARNYAGGNTMVLNRTGTDLMRLAAARVQADQVHDWWIYQVVTGCGGTALFDDDSQILYRQHDGNQIGANIGARALLLRLRDLGRGRYRTWTDANIANLEVMRDRLTPENAALLDQVKALRDLPVVPRLRAFADTGIHRDGPLGQAGMWASVLLGQY